MTLEEDVTEHTIIRSNDSIRGLTGSAEEDTESPPVPQSSGEDHTHLSTDGTSACPPVRFLRPLGHMEVHLSPSVPQILACIGNMA